MRKQILLEIWIMLIILIAYSSSFSQKNNNPLLFNIEDSLRDKLHFNYDSTWIHSQLNVKKSVSSDSNYYPYKLIKIGKRNFREGPHAIINKELDSVKYTSARYGDSVIILTGEKIYTYIGNSSWGYYQTYHLLRKDFMVQNRRLVELERLCKHGLLVEDSMACFQCLKNKNDSLPLKTIDLSKYNPNTCEHGHPNNVGQACGQCLHNYRMQYDSVYKQKHLKDSAERVQRILMGGCNHGHICCQTDCPCCPEGDKSSSFKVQIPLEYIKQNNCDHGHDCCSIGCECCSAQQSKRKKRKLKRKQRRANRKAGRRNKAF